MQNVKPLETLLVVNITLQPSFMYTGNRKLIIAVLAMTLLCLLFPLLLDMLHRGWTAIFSFIGTLNACILLAALYFLLLVPLAFLRKISTRRSIKSLTDTYINREHLFMAGDFERRG